MPDAYGAKYSKKQQECNKPQNTASAKQEKAKHPDQQYAIEN
jgi:hypothetical protein